MNDNRDFEINYHIIVFIFVKFHCLKCPDISDEIDKIVTEKTETPWLQLS